MRHQRAGVHLSRTSAHRKALFANLVSALFTHERIRTTDAKAKATRRIAERTITIARRLGDVLTKTAEKRSPEESARVVHAMRFARIAVRDRGAVQKLFDEIGPRFLGRPGGYTRIVKIGQRPGDAAPMSLLELMPDENAPAKVATKDKSAEGAASKGKTSKADKGDKSASAAPKAEAKGGRSKAPKAESKGSAGASGASKARAKKPAGK
jgi:large subunit ribosomal protein L17